VFVFERILPPVFGSLFVFARLSFVLQSENGGGSAAAPSEKWNLGGQSDARTPRLSFSFSSRWYPHYARPHLRAALFRSTATVARTSRAFRRR
jgi:hypothetical protein|tara:strand:+ start:2266 stop:2544 length:279 start_codon:yes stop_codon:yes gene_type:complete